MIRMQSGRYSALAIPTIRSIQAILATFLIALAAWHLVHSESVGFRVFVSCYLIGGSIALFMVGRDLWRYQYRGAIHVALVANSRTLAIVRYRAATLFVKRRDIASFGEDGDTLILKGGRQLDIRCLAVPNWRMRREFLSPLGTLWCGRGGICSGARRVEEQAQEAAGRRRSREAQRGP